MSLRLALAAALGFLTVLSSLMLGLGQNDASLPVLMGIAAVTSFFLTDYRRIIQLGDWTVNVFVILIAAFNVVDVLNHRGEDLAWSIARVLVFVQVVLLFREKEARFCWQILLISLLQVIVATVFQQGVMFALLLVLYIFVGLCAFMLLFLQQEHRYFRRHSFVKTFAETVKSEMTARQDRGKLVRLALLTLLMGPLTLVMSFGKKQTEQKTAEQKKRTQEILRSLFLIFPTDEDIARKEHWEQVEDTPSNENLAFHDVPDYSSSISSFAHCRFPLLTECPRFSAGTQNPRPWSGNWRELFFHLTLGTFLAFFMAIPIFCLVPRVGRIEVNHITLKPDFERWLQPVRRHVNVGTVGINEEIQLGTLGSVIPYHRAVIKVRFLRDPNNKLVTSTDSSANPYREIVGATLYFRGIPLDTYIEGTWSHTLATSIIEQREEELDLFSDGEMLTTIPEFSVSRIGTPLQPRDQQSAFFESGCDLVTLVMTIQPLDSPVFFAPHPFFSIPKPGEIEVRGTNGRSEETQRRRLERNKTIATTVFKHGVQLDFVPCQEWIYSDDLLQIPDKGLASLKALAARWDAESKRPQEDIIGRARFMEQKFLHSRAFSYQLGGTIRDYDRDPLEDFIAHNPQGHCEYFAGALALMLRSVGIRSRVVLGFKTDVEDPNAVCTIRQSDAHAWVEVYVPPEAIPQRTTGQYAGWWENGGWLRLDPTPVSDSDGSPAITALTQHWTDWNRYVQAFWSEWVLNMTPRRQSEWFYAPFRHVWHFGADYAFNGEFWRIFFRDMALYYYSFLSDIPRERRTWDGYYLVMPFVILGLVGLAYWRLTLMLRTRRKETAEDLRRKITVEFYFRMERLLATIGQIRAVTLTPLEFVRQSSFTPLTLPVVEAFYRVKFGNVTLTDEESKTVMHILDKLEYLIACGGVRS